jgi:lysozyme
MQIITQKNKNFIMKITKISENGINLIKKFEGLSLKPYLCPAKIPTIGYGNTFYKNGKKVTLNDKPITEQKAVEMLKQSLEKFEQYVDSYCIDTVTQNQFDALVSFCYNLGPTNLKSSTLLKKVNNNPNDPTIKDEFMKWTKASGRKLAGLVKRRDAESTLYFS